MTARKQMSSRNPILTPRFCSCLITSAEKRPSSCKDNGADRTKAASGPSIVPREVSHSQSVFKLDRCNDAVFGRPARDRVTVVFVQNFPKAIDCKLWLSSLLLKWLSDGLSLSIGTEEPLANRGLLRDGPTPFEKHDDCELHPKYRLPRSATFELTD